MIKRVVAVLTLCLIAFSCVACGGDGDNYKNFEVAVKGEKTTVNYESKELSASEFNFCDAETPERLYAVFGDYETGSPDVAFSGKIRKLNDRIVVGLSVGDSPRFAGVYVRNYGFFFLNEQSLNGGEFAVALKEIPSGIFTFAPFSIIGDQTVVGKTSLSFTHQGAVVAQGESNDGFTVYDGLVSLYDGDFSAVTDSVFSLSKSTVFSLGNISAQIKGDAGVTIGVSAAVVGDVSGANFVFAGVCGGKARISEFVGGTETVIIEETIDGYSANEFINLTVVANDSGITLTAGGKAVFAADKKADKGNAGFMLRAKAAATKDIVMPQTTLEEYKAYAIEMFDAVKTADIYEVAQDGLLTTRAVKTTVDYSEDSSVKKSYDKAVKAINAVTELSRAQEAFDRYYGELEEKVVEIYKTVISNNLEAAVEQWYSVMSFDNLVSNYIAGNDRVQIEGMSFIISVRTLYDDRWWIRDPFKPAIILSAALNDIENTDSKVILDNLYEQYYIDILRAVFQKTFETYYSIKKNADQSYDQVGIIWNLIWSYNNGNYEIVYDGPMKAYKGTVYHIGDETNPVRMSGMLYNPSQTRRDIEWLANDAFPFGLNILRTGALPE